jgi:Icc-related predicted phosphoesterase
LAETKVLFASDLHSSEVFFLKCLTTAKNFNVDLLLISGDLTGKAIVPIVKLDSGKYVTNFMGVDYKVAEAELPPLQRDIRKCGYYWMIMSLKEYEGYKGHPEKIEALFDNVTREAVEHWVRKIEEVLPKEMRVVLNPGNDDTFAVDETLKKEPRIEYTVGKVYNIDDHHEMINCDWVNPTPWNSPRECPDEELERRLRTEIKKASNIERLICDFHAPPYNTPIDSAPKLGKNMKPKFALLTGQPEYEHVGSKAVRKVLEEFQPKMGLHGHIHESAGVCKIGRTVCVNPGSEYLEGTMHGYLLKLTPEGLDQQPLIGG